MKLIALTLVKIDGDIIEEFVRHTLKFVDELIVVNNASLDSTSDILSALVTEGLPLTIWQDEIVAERPSITTDLARRAFAYATIDYLLILDADEFIKVPSRAALEVALAALPTGAHAAVPWENYVPTPDDDAQEPRILARLRYRRSIESMPYSKLFLSASFKEQPKASIVYGNHGIDDPDALVAPLREVKLAHFPVRSLSQIQSKALLGWSMFLAMGYEEESLAYQWRRLYDRLTQSPYWSDNDFLRSAWYYLDDTGEGMPDLICDPLPPVSCRYASPTPDLLRIAIAYTRQLAKSFARLNAENERLRGKILAAESANSFARPAVEPLI